jgi:hypothetical protein
MYSSYSIKGFFIKRERGIAHLLNPHKPVPVVTQSEGKEPVRKLHLAHFPPFLICQRITLSQTM